MRSCVLALSGATFVAGLTPFAVAGQNEAQRTTSPAPDDNSNAINPTLLAKLQSQADQRVQRGAQPIETPEERKRRAEERAAEIRRRHEESIRQIEDARLRQEGLDPEAIRRLGEGALENGAVRPQTERDALVGGLVGQEGMIELSSAGPVELPAFVDYVARTLNINIFSSEALVGRTFTLASPHKVPAGELLTLLAVLLEQQGFVLTTDPSMGWYKIIASEQVGPMLQDGPFATTEMIATPLAKPSVVASLLTQQLGPAASSVRISPLDDLGALIVTGSPRTIRTIQSLVDRLSELVVGPEFHRFFIERVSADFALQRILRLNGMRQSTAQQTPGTPGGAVSSGTALSDLASRLMVEQGNALVFRGTAWEADRVREYIAWVDILSPLRSIKYIAGPDAMDVALAGQREGLGSVDTSQSAGSTGFGRQVTSGAIGTQRGTFGGQQGQQEVELAGSRFLVNMEEGSVLYHGTDAQHERVKAIVETFVAQAQPRRVVVRAYKLEHALSESVVQILNDLLQDNRRDSSSPFLPQSGRATTDLASLRDRLSAALGGEGAEGTAGSPGDFSVTSADVVITEDRDRNQVLVKATQRQQVEIEQVIRQLDQRQPQVYIEAKIVSVTSSKAFDWTADTQLNIGQFLLYTGFGAAVPATTPTGPRLPPANATGITSALIKSDYVPFVINALETVGDTRIVSNPQILVNDNADATLGSQREEPFSSTSQGQATTITTQGGVASAGTTLAVTPSISAGGYLRLQYEIELSDFTGTGQGGLQPPTQRETYSSSVTVPGDMTIVVGGFQLETDREDDRRIPILGDIPIIGALFKDYSNSKRRTTIFVFITPRIIYETGTDKLKIISEGPLKLAGLDPDIPDLEPVLIPIDSLRMMQDRILPQNRAILDLSDASQPD